MVALDVGSKVDRRRTRLGSSNDHAAVVPPRVGVSPAHLVGDPIAGGAQADVVDPAEQVKVFGSQRATRHRSPFNQTAGHAKTVTYLSPAGSTLRAWVPTPSAAARGQAWSRASRRWQRCTSRRC